MKPKGDIPLVTDSNGRIGTAVMQRLRKHRGVVGDADPAPWLMVGDSYPIHSKSCRYDLKRSSPCSLRQNNRSKDICPTPDFLPSTSRYV